ncbi:hypothetical protein MYCTH_2306732 [Thermothelomyces thermophilus ATCC 42464]|uniref:Uncharacterized protein n=1 Tax=Thermothelomyces thermophilus (strain ATCC 42464 / BCRC 31852 / DSM 1799) TaxID=573729 RepID=G2QHT8_THET4|nr:uncharacterized protein MYCTH_2306732 [Thermothelomyces thermophilus ATCC 42464]AEO58948.1 hypothetical protein MYCTH_2306732 [Thermothelomyces thermophilus ATCC 42464]
MGHVRATTLRFGVRRAHTPRVRARVCACVFVTVVLPLTRMKGELPVRFSHSHYAPSARHRRELSWEKRPRGEGQKCGMFMLAAELKPSSS